MNAKDCAMDAPREPAILQMMQQHGGHNPPRKVLQAKAATDSSGLLNLCGERREALVLGRCERGDLR